MTGTRGAAVGRRGATYHFPQQCAEPEDHDIHRQPVQAGGAGASVLMSLKMVNITGTGVFSRRSMDEKRRDALFPVAYGLCGILWK